MPDPLTTDEAAAYLRLSERKLYELVANAAVPCTKVTGKWLFPKAALERWLVAGLAHARPYAGRRRSSRAVCGYFTLGVQPISARILMSRMV
jgi:excisionase family DNA binding protein